VDAGALFVTRGAAALPERGAHLGLAGLPPVLGSHPSHPTSFAQFAAQRRSNHQRANSLVRSSAPLPSLAPVAGFAPTRRR
jgi:hypothetical protein